MTYKNPQKFDLKIRLYNQEKSFGKGVYELMKKTQSFGSLTGAYKAMKMSNSKAWKILKRAEEDLDMPLIERISGIKVPVLADLSMIYIPCLVIRKISRCICRFSFAVV